MNVQKNKIQEELEITVELSVEEMKPHIKKACEIISQDMKIEGFRPGHVPFNILKNQVGEITILQEAANIAVNKTVADVIKNNIAEDDKPIGQPQIRITKVAPNNPVEYKINVSLMPEVKLEKYKDLGIKKEEVKIEEAKVDGVIEDLRNMRAQEKIKTAETHSDVSAQDGDKILSTFRCF